MRKFLLFALVGLSGLMFTSCEEEPKQEPTNTAMLVTIDFEDVNLNGNEALNNVNFISDSITFQNNFTDWGGGMTSWSGFACSTKTDTLTAGYTNDLSVCAGKAFSGNQFGVYSLISSDPEAFLVFPNDKEYVFKEMKVTNNSYAYISMRDGDAFSKQFAADDWFKLTIYGYNAAGLLKDSVEHYLADFRNGGNYISKDWASVQLDLLGVVNKLTFKFSSSDEGAYGMNTPAYVCIDDITYSKEE